MIMLTRIEKKIKKVVRRDLEQLEEDMQSQIDYLKSKIIIWQITLDFYKEWFDISIGKTIDCSYSINLVKISDGSVVMSQECKLHKVFRLLSVKTDLATTAEWYKKLYQRYLDIKQHNDN